MQASLHGRAQSGDQYPQRKQNCRSELFLFLGQHLSLSSKGEEEAEKRVLFSFKAQTYMYFD